MRRATSQWQWDAFEYALHVQTYPLATLMKHMLTHSGLMDEFKLRSVHAERRLDRFLVAVDMHYHRPIRNPAEDRVDVKSTQGEEGGDGLRVGYHNVIHACDVLQSTYAYIHLGGLIADAVSQVPVRDALGGDGSRLWHPASTTIWSRLPPPRRPRGVASGALPLPLRQGGQVRVRRVRLRDGRGRARAGHGRYFAGTSCAASGDGHGHVQARRHLARVRSRRRGAGGWSPPSSDARWKDLVQEAKKWSAYCEERRVEDRNRRTEEDPAVRGWPRLTGRRRRRRSRGRPPGAGQAAGDARAGRRPRPPGASPRGSQGKVEVLFEEFWRLGDRSARRGWT